MTMMENAIQVPFHQISEVFKTSEISHLAPFLQIGKKEAPTCQNQTSEVLKTSEVLNPLP